MSNTKFLMYVSLAIGLAFGLLHVFYVGLNNDTEIFMYDAFDMLRFGRDFYAHRVQVNPPFYIFMDMPLAYIATHAHIAPAVVLHGYAFIMSVICLLSLQYALKKHQLADDERRLWIAGVSFALFVAPSMFNVYGDCEHLLFIYALPWMIQMILRLPPLPYSCVLAGIGFCMKPYDMTYFALMALTGGPKEWSFLRRIFSYSSLIIGGIFSCYVATVALCFPAYLHDVLPIGTLTYSSVSGGRPMLPVKRGRGILYIFALLAVVWRCIRSRDLRLGWLGFVVGAFIPYYLNEGWIYTRYLLMAPAVLACLLPWMPSLVRESGRRPMLQYASIFVLIALLAGESQGLTDDMAATAKDGFAAAHYHLEKKMYDDLKREAGSKFILLSGQLWYSSISTYGGEPDSVFAYDVLWPLHWLYHNPDQPGSQRVLHGVTDPLVRSLTQYPKAPVILDQSPDLRLLPRKDILEYLKQDPRVDEAFRPYVLTATYDNCDEKLTQICRFTVWRRHAP